MKKYSVFELYVVKIEKYCFICEKLDDNIYKEIFTREKFKVLNSNNIELLSNYYSIIEIKNYSTGEVLMLSKIQLLVKYAEINAPSIENEKKKRAYEDFIEYQEQCLNVLKDMREKNPEMAREIAIDNLRKSGILDENDELAEVYRRFSKSLKKND